ncbi:sigma 54-interacting transcriptional regulator [Oceanobacillus sp. FSL W7-1304]|uniref:sigma 54-interacting transcriptional regulator n=1 Tax=Oceanobacillus sp. FSL W7-1304 TaxID=2975322 RepID=UPI0030D7BAF7
MKKRLIIIGIQEDNLLFLKNQLEYIFGTSLQIEGLTLKELNSDTLLSSDLVLLSAMEIQELVKPFLPEAAISIVAQRTENIGNLKELIFSKQRKNILVVNDNYNNTIQTLESLKLFLPNHTFYPYISEKPMPDKIDFVITPGETNLIPKGFPRMIDIGPRIISLETLIQIKQYCQLDMKVSLLTQLYIKAMIYATDKKTESLPISIHDQNQHRTLDSLKTSSPSLQSTIRIASKLAKTPDAIHIEGGTGTGKQMLAEMIHNDSTGAALPFYVYNCLDKEPQLIEKELFGSKDEKIEGIINAISGGTLYIKHIDQLPYALQGKLFNLIESNDLNPMKNRIRIITSSLESLATLFQKGIIRTYLYSYMSSYVLQMPSLKERKNDLSQLIEAFKGHFNRIDLVFSTDAMEAFYHYDWPGNVRELYNVISYCVCLNTTSIGRESLPLFFKGNQKFDATENTEQDLGINEIIRTIEKHGFLSESISLLQIYQKGKKQNESYGRRRIKQLLSDEQYSLTDQQLRLRIEVLNKTGLLNVRKGRAGTTISAKGEQFLDVYQNELRVQ